jgi:hypothetical protein
MGLSGFGWVLNELGIKKIPIIHLYQFSKVGIIQTQSNTII